MSLSISMPKACAISCAMRGQPKRGLRRLNSTIASMSSFEGPSAGAPMTSRREKPPTLAFLKRRVEPEQGSGLQDDRELRNSACRHEQGPKTQEKAIERIQVRRPSPCGTADEQLVL